LITGWLWLAHPKTFIYLFFAVVCWSKLKEILQIA
jgi:hypothetical protein